MKEKIYAINIFGAIFSMRAMIASAMNGSSISVVVDGFLIALNLAWFWANT